MKLFKNPGSWITEADDGVGITGVAKEFAEEKYGICATPDCARPIESEVRAQPQRQIVPPLSVWNAYTSPPQCGGRKPFVPATLPSHWPIRLTPVSHPLGTAIQCNVA